MKDNKFFKGLLTGILVSFACIVVFTLVLTKSGALNMTRLLGYSDNHTKLENTIMDKVNVLEGYIDQYFLDEIDEEKVADEVYKGVINGLDDKYAAYYNADEYKEIMESSNGVYCGIGAYIAKDSKTDIVMIVKPMEGSPCEKAGAKAGDLIYAVDGEDVTGKDISEVQALVKGEKGSKVKLTLIRNQKEVNITVTRDDIEDITVASKMLDNKIGYVQVTGFEQVTPKQFSEAITALEKDGMNGLIVDLRDNGGGLLDSAVSMLDTMLPEGVVVYSKDKAGKKEEYSATNDDAFTKPLAILVNENSASASEVFSGAIQDNGTGKLIGTKTYGKGIVQGIFPLGDGSALKMTTAKYYTPKGRNIHGKGLTPDIEVELSKSAEKLPKSKTKVDNQLKTAFDYLLEETSK